MGSFFVSGGRAFLSVVNPGIILKSLFKSRGCRSLEILL